MGPEFFAEDWAKAQLAAILRKLRRRDGGALSDGNRLQIYFWGDPAFDAMREAIEDARVPIHLVIYIFMAEEVGRLFAEALGRKIEVGLLVPEITDVPLADWIRERLLPEFPEMGLTIRDYPRAVLQAKTMVVDGDLAVVGSTNYDDLSIALNLERSIVGYDREFAGKLLEQYASDLACATPIDLERARDRRWWQKMEARLAGYLVRRL